MSYTIYENRPHRRHFTVHRLQWSITFLTEYISKDYLITAYLFTLLSTKRVLHGYYYIKPHIIPKKAVSTPRFINFSLSSLLEVSYRPSSLGS